MNTCGSRLAIDGVSQAHTACSGCSSTLGYALRSNPNSTIAASQMLDKSLVNAYGEPVHTHSLSLHLSSPSGSQEVEFLPDRRQTSLCSVAGGEPHALLYGSSLCAKAFAPVKGKGHSHHTAANLRLVSLSLFAPVAAYANKCLFGQRCVNTWSYNPRTHP